MVPKAGFEPAQASPTTPSRWRVYQFHHFGTKISRTVTDYAPRCQANSIPDWIFLLFTKRYIRNIRKLFLHAGTIAQVAHDGRGTDTG